TAALCFLFSACGAHLALHSFPTRRSSDLAVPVLGGDPAAHRQPTLGRGELAGQALDLRRGDPDRRGHVLRRGEQALEAGRIGGRSEEHTSELQSRRDLVCRLLLEKKKKKD